MLMQSLEYFVHILVLQIIDHLILNPSAIYTNMRYFTMEFQCTR